MADLLAETGSLTRYLSQSEIDTVQSIPAFPDHISNTDLATLEAAAKATPPALKPADWEFSKRCVAMIANTLPSQRVSETGGQLKVGAYRIVLQGLSQEAVEWATTQILKEFDWCPSPHQMLEYAQRYQHPHDRIIRRATALIEYDKRNNRNSSQAPPLTQDDIDKMPEEMLSLGVSVGAIIIEDGKHIPAPPERPLKSNEEN